MLASYVFGKVLTFIYLKKPFIFKAKNVTIGQIKNISKI